ncbi:MAG: YvcK family protein [Chloroflexota bacterium]|nr:YvcK family protein [Chloroflexia bacterium]MDQ3226029.1 YvcK family protein [Chloroflexota bacterium]
MTIPRGWRTWLRPGMHVKRWAALFLLGTVLTGLAIAMGLVYSYRYVPFPGPVSGVVQALTLQFLPRELRFVIVFSVGIGFMVYGFYRFSRGLIMPVLAHSKADKQLVQIVAEHRFGRRHPEVNVVALGGGTGLATLLRGLKQHELAITAIVTVADDGGSTGKIRSAYDIPAPGDIRNCLVALADDESLVSRLFQYRFNHAGSELDGHSFGNLFITALTKVTGSFERAVIESASVLNIRGRVLPSTLANVRLDAELTNGTSIEGESNIQYKQAPILRMRLSPDDPAAYLPAVTAILNADLIVLGPGSLYTSIVPNLLVPDILRAVRASSAPRVYVMNVATQTGETDHFTALDHLEIIDKQLGSGKLDAVLINSNTASAAAIGPNLTIDPVLPDTLNHLDPRIRVIARDMVSAQNPLRHDPEKLASALLELTNGGWFHTAPGSEAQRLGNLVSAPRRDLTAAGISWE